MRYAISEANTTPFGPPPSQCPQDSQRAAKLQPEVRLQNVDEIMLYGFTPDECVHISDSDQVVGKIRHAYEILGWQMLFCKLELD